MSGNKEPRMRYRRWSYRYTVVERPAQRWPFGDIWQTDRLRLLVPLHWRPDTDVYETASAIEMIVDLAGVDEDDFEIQLFEDVLVVDGQRRIPSGQGEVVYHAAGIRQGPFRVEARLPAAVDAEGVEAHYDRGVLRITLPKRVEAR
jgi:HSP20 family molecular chaperone IbpA